MQCEDPRLIAAYWISKLIFRENLDLLQQVLYNENMTIVMEIQNLRHKAKGGVG